VAGFAAFFTALWLLWTTPVVFPLKIFVVLLHELSHAAASLATGGSVERIVLDPGQGGACHCPGGNAFVVLSAGYLGSLAWGAAMFVAARSPGVPARHVNLLIGAVVLGATALYVRNPFGLGFGTLFGAALLVAARRAGGTVNRSLLYVLGLTSCMYSLLDIKSDILDRPGLRSDARMLAELTGVPTTVWGVVWIAAGIAVSWSLLRRAYRAA